jgi:hypothetical protein
VAIVKSTFQALNSGDRYNLIDQGVGWEILDTREHRIVQLFFDEQEARDAYAALATAESR